MTPTIAIAAYLLTWHGQMGRVEVRYYERFETQKACEQKLIEMEDKYLRHNGVLMVDRARGVLRECKPVGNSKREYGV